MFDLIAGTRSTKRRRGLMPLSISLAGHILLVASIVIPALFVTDKLPQLPTMMAFVAPSVTPPPPPPPPAVAAKPAARANPVSPSAAPITIPDRIEPEAAFERVEEGVPGGVEGGISGGVVGGIVGGISDAPPLAPPSSLSRDMRKPVRVGGDLSAPTLLLRVPPVYPEMAQKAHIQGLVILEAAVDEHGSVTDVTVLRSVRFLDEAAVDAVRQWRYSPLLLNGQPMPFVLTVTVSFRIDAAR